MNARALIFAVWIKNAKNRANTITALEQIASGQVSVFTQGGKTMISSSVGSESFSFQLSGALSADRVQEMAYDAWRAISRFATDADFLAWIKADEVNGLRMGFGMMEEV
jgi:hypothetical protein